MEGKWGMQDEFWEQWRRVEKDRDSGQEAKEETDWGRESREETRQ